MNKFRAWNDAVRILSGDWALEPGRKPKRYRHEVEMLMREVVEHRATPALTFMVLILILIF